VGHTQERSEPRRDAISVGSRRPPARQREAHQSPRQATPHSQPQIESGSWTSTRYGRPYHLAIRDIEKDKLKDAKLLTIGIRTLRITDTPFNYDRAGVYDDLLGLLKLR
jgi:hypothetical protein